MTINFNFSLRLALRAIRALEQLARDYHTVHAQELELADTINKPVDKNVGHVYYQDDRKVWEEEQKAKLKRLEEYGEEGLL